MPDLGRLRRDRLPHAAPVTRPLYPPLPWSLPSARILKIAFETDGETALDWLPPSLGRTSPAYALIIVAHHPESPAGPFSLAAQYLGCRARMLVRAFALQAVTDSEPALAALREVLGIPARLGRVRLSAGPRTARAIVDVGGRTVADVRLARGQPCDPTLIRYDPVLGLRLIPANQPGKRHALMELLQIDPEYRVREALRGQARLSYPQSNEDDGWGLLPPLNMIAASYTVGDTELPLARFVMPY